MTPEDAKRIEDAGINSVFILHAGKKLKVVGNWCVDTAVFKDKIDLEKYGIKEKVYYPAMMDILEEEDLEKAVVQNYRKLCPAKPENSSGFNSRPI